MRALFQSSDSKTTGFAQTNSQRREMTRPSSCGQFQASLQIVFISPQLKINCGGKKLSGQA
jgi:hypothetical protein